jgi:hypothetical protein
MTNVELLRQEADFAYGELETALDGVDERQAWAKLPNLGPDYLHTDATIYGITLHIASTKFMYASLSFNDSELRWRDIAERLDAFEPDWQAALGFLREGHEYWMRSWAELDDEALLQEVPHFSGRVWPIWQSIRTMNHHDAWHGGQIVMLRYGVAESGQKPESVAEDIREHCVYLPSW